VVTVPAAADDLFRNATITSSVIAFSTSSKTINRDNVNILNEPSAAALSYAYS
jgi:molecular chaperone DnaK (HSP70)